MENYSDNKRNEKLKVIVASRLIKEKGVDVFIKAISLLPLKMNDMATFIIAGEGIFKEELLKLSIELETNIEFVGVIENMQEYLHSSNILVNPTKEIEGFPTILTEAGFQKNLVISSNFKGFNSILKDGNNCLIYDMNDENSLRDKLFEAIENFHLYGDIVNNFHSDCTRYFSVDNMINNIIEVYEFEK